MTPSRVTIADVGFSCGTCFYWANGTNCCLRHPPTAGGFPRCLHDDVCGEWESDQQPPERLGLAEVGGEDLPGFDQDANDLHWPVSTRRCHVAVSDPDDASRIVPCGAVNPCKIHDRLQRTGDTDTAGDDPDNVGH